MSFGAFHSTHHLSYDVVKPDTFPLFRFVGFESYCKTHTSSQVIESWPYVFSITFNFRPFHILGSEFPLELCYGRIQLPFSPSFSIPSTTQTSLPANMTLFWNPCPVSTRAGITEAHHVGAPLYHSSAFVLLCQDHHSFLIIA